MRIGGSDMSQDVREYFKNCSMVAERRAVYTGTQLARGGVSDMDALCTLLLQEPEKLLGLRGIGQESMEVIREACAHYHDERGDTL